MFIMCLSKGIRALQVAVDEGLLPNRVLGFIPTAGDTYENPYFVENSRKRLKLLGIQLVELDIAREIRETLLEKLKEIDGLYVAGGNSFYLLYQLLQKDLLGIIAQRVRDGLPYFGESAGAVLLVKSIEPAQTIDDPGAVPELTNYEGLDLIDYFPLPHVDQEKYKAIFEEFVRVNSDKLKIIQYTDEQAILTRDGVLCEILPSAVDPV